MTTDELVERAARIIADAALDWTDIESGEHGHSPECANWQPYTHEARSVLALFEQAQAEPEWEYGTTCAVPGMHGAAPADTGGRTTDAGGDAVAADEGTLRRSRLLGTRGGDR